MKLYKDFERHLQPLGVSVVAIPARVLTAATLSTEEDASTSKIDPTMLKELEAFLPAKMFESLADFQKVGVHWGAMKKNGRCLIADEVN